ncbi:CvfB family protein [Celerinatantimonas yamalensis]|uniref:S1-like domain-containing RNA-binding protein n=1 Tax=Celerinatantimonas yamalensis TaxID=559956 RepID=A0ABW9G4J3_9GAMM
MLQIGRIQPLRLVRVDANQAILQSQDERQIPMPSEQLPEGLNPGDSLEAFIYPDSQEQLVATTHIPHAQIGQVAWLQVVAVHPIGAFLDLGIDKDVFVATHEQYEPMHVGQSYAVFLYLDDRGRLAATPRLSEHLCAHSDYQRGQIVTGLISARSELGYQVAIDHQFLGMLYHNELFQRVRVGQTINAYVLKNRDDGRLDLRQQPIGDHQLDELQQRILRKLDDDGGYLGLSDKSDPKLIAAVFGVSKGQYKKAIGHLYRQKLIKISATGILRYTD